MEQREELPLMLGGHSFVQQLGNDPIPDAGVVIEIVAACLDERTRAVEFRLPSRAESCRGRKFRF